MSASAIIGMKMAVLPRVPATGISTNSPVAPPRRSVGGGLVIECSSRPQKKATAHHMKTRPKKKQAWDIKRGPTVYPPLPQLPPEWSFASDESGQPGSAVAGAAGSEVKSE